MTQEYTSKPDTNKEVRDKLHEVFFPLNVNMFYHFMQRYKSNPDFIDKIKPSGSYTIENTGRTLFPDEFEFPLSQTDWALNLQLGRNQVSCVLPFKSLEEGGNGEEFAVQLAEKVQRMWGFIESNRAIIFNYPFSPHETIFEHQEIIDNNTLQKNLTDSIMDSAGSLAANIALHTIDAKPNYESPWAYVQEYVEKQMPEKIARVMQFGVNGELANGLTYIRQDELNFGVEKKFLRSMNCIYNLSQFPKLNTYAGCPEAIAEPTPNEIKQFFENPPETITGIHLHALMFLAI